MAYEFKFPDIGEGITEGEIVEWKIKEGDTIKEHDVLGKIETDKAVAEIPSPVGGTILKIHFKPGDAVKVGETMVTIGQKGEKISGTAQPASAQVQQPKQQPVKQQLPAQPAQMQKQPVFKPAGAVGYLEEAPEEVAAVKKLQSDLQKETRAEGQIATVLATPATRQLAKDLGVDLSTVSGRGLGGRITGQDVRNAAGPEGKIAGSEMTAMTHAEAPEAGQPEILVERKYDAWGYVERVPMKGVRKAIAKKMVESATHAVHVTAFDEADVSKLWSLREREKNRSQLEGFKLTFLPFVVKACVHALKEHPFVNSTLGEQSDEIILKKYYNIGIAVDTPEGLMVPVIKGADQKSIKNMAKEIEELAEKARQRTIDLGDLKGGTFSITNYGSIRGTYATPIINYPEAAILGMGRIFDKIVVEGEKAYKRKILPLSLSFDHRIFDGADAAQFMQTLIEHLEDPDLILVDD